MKITKETIDSIYINMLLMSISRKCSFPKLVKAAEEEIKQFTNENIGFLPEGFNGLFFVELLARKMGSSLGEIYNLSEERKEEILCELMSKFYSINEAYANYFDDSCNGNIEFQGSISVLDASDEDKILEYYHGFFSGIDNPEHSIYTNYRITFQRFTEESELGKLYYTITIEGLRGFASDYVYDSYEVWEGISGPLADFIELVIQEHTDTCIDNEEKEIIDSKEEVSSQLSHEKIEVEKPVIESELVNEGPKIIDELVKYIFDDTRTVDLLDKFEGYGQSEPIRYRRLVIQNCKYWRYAGKNRVGFNLVVERGRGSDYVGNVTFTEFKKGEAYGLAKYVESEITDEIIEQYADKDQFYRFSKPYLLRAQNSSNRTGYGWEWDWSGGYGDYTEGTLYGETTNYFFVGVYITSNYSYEPSKRISFSENRKDIVKNSKLHNIIFYEGKLCDLTKNETIHKYFKLERNSEIKYIPVSYDSSEDIYYIAEQNCRKYRNQIENGNYELKRNFVD